jgi:hypothetical protein
MVNALLDRIAWLVSILTIRVYFADAFMTVSPPSSGQCMARSALLDPFTVVNSDDASCTKEPTFHTSARQSHQTFTLQVLERLWQSATSVMDSSSSASASDSANPSRTQRQPFGLLGHLWTSAIQFLNTASAARTTDALLVQQDEWQAYQCTASRDSMYSYARGHVYYFNTLTGESQWEKPHANFPTPQALPLPNGYDLWDTIPVMATASRAKQSATALWATSKDTSDEASSTPVSVKPTSWWDMLSDLQRSISEIFPSTAKSNEQTEMEQNSAIDDTPKPWWSLVFDGFKQAEMPVRHEESISSPASSSNVPTFQKRKQEDSWWWTFASGGVNDNVSNETTTPSIPTLDSSLANPILESRTESPISPWDILFGKVEKDKTVNTELYAKSAPADTLSDTTLTEEQQHSPPLRYSDWVENLSLYLTRDTSRTRSLFSLKNVPVVGAIIAPEKTTLSPSAPASSPSESSPTQKTGALANPNTAAAIREAREKALQEKRYAASLARQANLRKNYDEVILDRSPTISLTAMKKSNKPASKTWFRYLED